MPIPSVIKSSASDVISDLKRKGTVQLTLADRVGICRTCVVDVCKEANRWAEEAAVAKGLAADSPIRAEDMLSGPVVIVRQLQLTVQTLLALSNDKPPTLPGQTSQLKNGQTVVPVFPTSGYFDSLTFMGLAGHVRMQPGVTPQGIHGNVVERVREGKVDGIVVVLGAGNVSSIPATDSLTKIMFEGRRVILKMNPVNEYLTPIFERAFRSLIDANLLRIITGGPDVGARLVDHPDVDEVHITGSGETHDAIVWGSDASERTRRKQKSTPVLSKTITSELGNVTPWIIVPGIYSARQLRSQAMHVAASITNNASFNCLATKAIITWNQWAQRDQFLDLVNDTLKKTASRPAYYPGAAERYRRFTESEVQPDDNGALPWTLLKAQSFDERPELFREESFVCVCAETSLAADSPTAFLQLATDFVNDQMAGTLCASVTFPSEFRRRQMDAVERCLQQLRYGSVCVNQWSGLAYGFVSPPWGAYPGATLDDVQSGIGSVHNTYLLVNFEKTVLQGPLVNFPKPIWFPSHKNALVVAERLLGLCQQPSVTKLPRLFAAALMG